MRMTLSVVSNISFWLTTYCFILELQECEVFGVSSDEYRNYAEKNRAEWVLKGQEVVEAMVEKFRNDEDTIKTVQV